MDDSQLEKEKSQSQKREKFRGLPNQCSRYLPQLEQYRMYITNNVENLIFGLGNFGFCLQNKYEKSDFGLYPKIQRRIQRIDW